MAGIQLSTAGVKLLYAAEATAGTRPTTGYKEISEIKSIPELNPEPDNLETTTLAETEWKTYIPGLKDIGGALSFTANLTEKSMEEWEGVVDAYDTAAADNKATWFCILPGSPPRWVCPVWRFPLSWRRPFTSPRPVRLSGRLSLLIWRQ